MERVVETAVELEVRLGVEWVKVTAESMEGDLGMWLAMQKEALETAKTGGKIAVGVGKITDEDAQASRFAILRSPEFRALSRRFFEVADGLNELDGKVDKYEYMVMMSKLSKALQPDFDPDSCLDILEEDWQQDSGGHDFLTFAQFNRSLFELADVWCSDVSLSRYLWFLNYAFGLISEPIPEGETATMGGPHVESAVQRVVAHRDDVFGRATPRFSPNSRQA